jgi:hypothetical protein
MLPYVCKKPDGVSPVTVAAPRVASIPKERDDTLGRVAIPKKRDDPFAQLMSERAALEKHARFAKLDLRTKAFDVAEELAVKLTGNLFEIGGVLDTLEREAPGYREGHTSIESYAKQVFGLEPDAARHWINRYRSLNFCLYWSELSTLNSETINRLVDVLAAGGDLRRWLRDAQKQDAVAFRDSAEGFLAAHRKAEAKRVSLADPTTGKAADATLS